MYRNTCFGFIVSGKKSTPIPKFLQSICARHNIERRGYFS